MQTKMPRYKINWNAPNAQVASKQYKTVCVQYKPLSKILHRITNKSSSGKIIKPTTRLASIYIHGCSRPNKWRCIAAYDLQLI
jgi:hypothetical protein